jgi:transposase
MEEKEFMKRASNSTRYDKRLIKRIVKEVEEGMPRKEANRIYGLGKKALDRWMNRYGSENYHQNLKRRIYTKLQKRSAVAAIEQGLMSIKEAQIAYNIGSVQIIKDWLLLYKDEKLAILQEHEIPMAAKKQLKKTTGKEALKKALNEAELKIKALNTLIDVAGESLNTDLRKKFGAKQSDK